MKLEALWEFTKQVLGQWIADRAPKLAAALSFYMLFSLAPLLVLSVAAAGFVYGRGAAQGELIHQLRLLLGPQGTAVVRTALANASNLKSGVVATGLSLAMLIVGATAAFAELQDSLNIIWRVKARPGRSMIEGLLLDRLVSFLMVVGVALLLLLSLLASTLLTALRNSLGGSPTPILSLLNHLDILLSLAVIFLLFAMIFRVLPDVEIAWSDVWIGALVTTVLFMLGKYLISLYLGISSLASVYGAAGSLAALLLWIYYSAQILYLGAEFTRAYTIRFGSGMRPSNQFVRYEERPLDGDH